jgi:hypothetical protein
LYEKSIIGQDGMLKILYRDLPLTDMEKQEIKNMAFPLDALE